MADTKPQLIKIMTPKGASRFASLTTPDTKFDPEGIFKTGIILPADSANQDSGKYKGQGIMDMLNEAAEDIFAKTKADLEESLKTLKGEKLAKAKKALAELKKGDLPASPEYDEDGNETGNIILNFKMKAQRKDKKTGKVTKMYPKLFDAAGKPLPKGIDIWGGSLIKVAGSLNPFYIPGTNTCGVGLRLAAVQVIELRSSGGGDAASYGFGKEDGYEAPESEGAQEGFEDESGSDEGDGEEDF